MSVLKSCVRDLYSRKSIRDDWDQCWKDYKNDPGPDWPVIPDRHARQMEVLMSRQVQSLMKQIKYIDYGPKPNKIYNTINKGMTSATISANTVKSSTIATGGSSNLFVQNSNQRVIVSNAKTDTTATIMRTNDLLERFMEFCSKEGATREEFLNLPIKTLIAFMIMVAAEEEGMSTEEESNVIKLEIKKPQPRCLQTKRFITKDAWNAGVRFINPKAMQDYMDRVAA